MAVNYVIIAAVFYAFDHLLRLIKTRVGTDYVQPLPEHSAVRLEIPKLSRGWRAGQHVRLRVLSSELGLTGWTESHPFTIATTSMSEGLSDLVLCAMQKVCQDFSHFISRDPHYFYISFMMTLFAGRSWMKSNSLAVCL